MNRLAKLFIVFTLTIITCSVIIYPFQVATAQTTDQTQYFNRQFAWDYGGYHWVWNLSIPESLYYGYKSVPDSIRIQNGPAGFDMMVTTQDSYMQTLVSKINDTCIANGFLSYSEVSFVLAFVQSIPYSTDLNSTGYQEYPRFPIETLVDQTGDCECKAILFATITMMLGYNCVFINPPDHLAVGVEGTNLTGTYWTYDNQNYYYCETTGIGFQIGQLPDEFNGVQAYVYPIYESDQYILNVQTSTTTMPYPNISAETPTPTPSVEPNPVAPTTATPTINQPTIEPAASITIRDPTLFVLIVLAIILPIIITIKTGKSPKQKTVAKQQAVLVPNQNLQNVKFCAYCGASNKSFAVYCENCGKQIG